MLSIKPFYFVTLLVILQSISRHCLCDDSDDSADSSDNSGTATVPPAPGTTATTTATATTSTTTTSTTAASTTNDVPCSNCPCFGAQTDFSQCLNDDCRLSIDVISGVTILDCDDLYTIITDGTSTQGNPGCIFTDSENDIYEVHGPIDADQMQCCQDILDTLYANAFEPAGCTGTTTVTTAPAVTTTAPPVTTNDVPCSICPCWGAQTDFSQCLTGECHLLINSGFAGTLLNCDDNLAAAVTDGTQSGNPACVLSDSENAIFETHGPIVADQVQCCEDILDTLYTNVLEPTGCTTTVPPATTPSALYPEGGEECPCDWPEDVTCVGACTYREEFVSGSVFRVSSIICGASSFVATNTFDCVEYGSNSGSSSIGNTFEWNACRNALYGVAVSEGCTLLISD